MLTVDGICFLIPSYVLTLIELFSSSPAYTFRKEGHTKVVEYDLTKKQKGALIRKRPNVLKEKVVLDFSNALGAMDDGNDSDAMDVDEPEPSDEEEGSGDDVQSNPGASGPARAVTGEEKGVRGRNERLVAPEECREHLRRLFRNEGSICALIFGRHGPFAPVSKEGYSPASADMFFMEVVAVPPTRFRPAARMGELMFEHPQNEMLAKMLSTSYRLRDYNVSLRSASEKKEGFDEVDRRKVMAQLLETLIQLQVDVNSFMDSSKNPAPMRQGKLPPNGVKQGLEKKEGLFRKHMMVRVYFICWSCSTDISWRVNVSTTLRAPSFLQMSILSLMKLESHPSLLRG